MTRGQNGITTRTSSIAQVEAEEEARQEEEDGDGDDGQDRDEEEDEEEARRTLMTAPTAMMCQLNDWTVD